VHEKRRHVVDPITPFAIDGAAPRMTTKYMACSLELNIPTDSIEGLSGLSGLSGLFGLSGSVKVATG
jgi:hypothetical protein